MFWCNQILYNVLVSFKFKLTVFSSESCEILNNNLFTEDIRGFSIFDFSVHVIWAFLKCPVQFYKLNSYIEI